MFLVVKLWISSTYKLDLALQLNSKVQVYGLGYSYSFVPHVQ